MEEIRNPQKRIPTTSGASLDSSRVEIIIQKLLQDYDVTYVADDLLKKWDRGELSEKDQDIAAQFLLNTGLLKTLQNQYSKQLTQDRYVAWIPFLEMLSRITKNIPDDIAEAILVGMTESNQLENIIHAQKSSQLHSRFQKVIKTYLEEKKQNLEKEKDELKKKLQRHIADRMDSEVQKVSLLLREKFPNDKEVFELTSDLDLIRIRTLVQKKERDLNNSLQDERSHRNTETSEEKNKIAQNAIENAKKNPSAAYDLAILLAQMEVYDAALTCLSYAPSSFEKDWLKLDLLLKCENYIDTITESFEIENKYPQNPNTIFSVLEYRAQALYGLGEKDKAIQILEKLLEISPKNQTARILLHSWEGR